MIISNFKIIENLLRPYQVYNLYYFKKIKGFCLDSRQVKKGDVFIALGGKYKDGHNYIKEAVKKGAVLIVSEKYINTKPKVPQFIVEDTDIALGRIISFLRNKHKKATVVAITGSLGKTTTKEILAFLIRPDKKVLVNKATENNILGVAKTIFSYKNHDLIIFELGTNKLGEISDLTKIVQPDIGVITCIKPTHLKGLGNLKKIKKEKLSILEANKKVKAILNEEDPQLSKVRRKNKTFWFGKNKKNDLYYRIIKRTETEVYFKILGKYDLILPLQFENFISNYLAATLTAHLLGFPFKDLILRLNSFDGFPPMRMEKNRIGNYTILNDAYNANPYSFKKSLSVLNYFKLPKVVIAADMLELGAKTAYYHRKLASQILKTRPNYCITYGKHAKITNNELKALNYKNRFHFDSHQKIADFLKNRLGQREYLIFLKGSRKMRLENILKYL